MIFDTPTRPCFYRPVCRSLPSARLGHANAAVTLGIYSHATTDAEAAAAVAAGALLSNVLGAS
jgi:hypothetical protein